MRKKLDRKGKCNADESNTADIISDLILVTVPLHLIRGLQDKGLRRRLTMIFSTSIVTTIVSLVHAAYILTLGGPKVLIAAIVEVRFSLSRFIFVSF